MHAISQTFTIAFGSVIAAAVLGIGLADRAADAASPSVAPASTAAMQAAASTAVVTRLPRVVIEHRRTPAVLAATSTHKPAAL